MSVAVGYRSLFTAISDDPSHEGAGAKTWGQEDPNQEFARRFGIARLYQRNENLITTLVNPSAALGGVNAALYKLGTDKADRYKTFLKEYRMQGFPEEEAVARADMLISRELENDLAMMQVKYPYALGGAAAGGWDPVSALLKDSNIRMGPNTFKAIQSSGGLGVGAGQGIGKSEKQRLIRKGMRRGRRK